MATTNPRADFPLLSGPEGKKIVYLDSAASTQKPAVLLDAEREYYEHANANVHRGIYALAEESTKRYEDARRSVAKRLQAKPDEVIFTSGATHSLNLAAKILESQVKEGDEILTTVAEHHSLFIPLQQLAKRKKVRLVVAPLTKGTITEAGILALVTPKTKIIGVAQASNVLGYTLDISKLHKKGIILLVDACQSIVHTPVSLKDCDMLAFSGHKAYGPMGIGVLASRIELLRAGEPLFYGGSMIERVTIPESTWAEPPARYEAGTPNVAGAIGLAVGLEYYSKNEKEATKREHELVTKADTIIRKYADVLGPETKARNAAIISFTMKNVHAHDVAQMLDSYGVNVRAGQHCCGPLHDALGIPASVRASIGMYTTEEDLAKLDQALAQVKKVFG